jgi:RNase P subunit RPR2
MSEKKEKNEKDEKRTDILLTRLSEERKKIKDLEKHRKYRKELVHLIESKHNIRLPFSWKQQILRLEIFCQMPENGLSDEQENLYVRIYKKGGQD